MTGLVLRIRAEGRPAPKGSRIQGKTKDGRMFTRPASRHEKPWVDAVKRVAELQARRGRPDPPYVIDIQLIIARPVKKSAKPWPSQHDLDKLARAVVDGLVFGGAIGDDRDVAELHASKRFAEPNETPGALVYVATQSQIVEQAA